MMNDAERDELLLRLDERTQHTAEDVEEIKRIYVPLDRFKPIERVVMAVGLTVITGVVGALVAVALKVGEFFK